MSYTSRFYGEVEERLQGKHRHDSEISESAIAAEAERIADTPSEFYPIMARIRPEAALDGIRQAWWAGDCETIDATAHDLLVAMGKGAKPEVSQETLEVLLLIAQRWGEDTVVRKGDEAEAEASRLAWREKHGKDHPCAQCRRGMGAILSDKAKASSTEILDDAKANFATMMPAVVG